MVTDSRETTKYETKVKQPVERIGLLSFDVWKGNKFVTLTDHLVVTKDSNYFSRGLESLLPFDVATGVRPLMWLSELIYHMRACCHCLQDLAPWNSVGMCHSLSGPRLLFVLHWQQVVIRHLLAAFGTGRSYSDTSTWGGGWRLKPSSVWISTKLILPRLLAIETTLGDRYCFCHPGFVSRVAQWKISTFRGWGRAAVSSSCVTYENSADG